MLTAKAKDTRKKRQARKRKKLAKRASRKKLKARRAAKHQNPENVIAERPVSAERPVTLAPGTRVRRGPDWVWNGQDYNGVGTVATVAMDLSFDDTPGWVYVRWDGGGFNCYRWGVDTIDGKKYDLEIVWPEDTQPVDLNVLSETVDDICDELVAIAKRS